MSDDDYEISWGEIPDSAKDEIMDEILAALKLRVMVRRGYDYVHYVVRAADS